LTADMAPPAISADATSALDKLRDRLKAGHTAGCLCQSRPGQSCRELRRIVGWEAVEMLEREVGHQPCKVPEGSR